MSTPSDAEIDRAVMVLRRGGVIGLPTETVYGLAADATSAAAVESIYRIKGRPPGHPLIVHLPDGAPLEPWAGRVPDAARVLADALWPGPLTVVVPRGALAIDAVCGTHPTVALRVPDHPVAQEVLARFGSGLAAPSANRFGRVSPTSAADVRAELGGVVEVVLDGGDAMVGVESTIVELVGEPRVLRPGGVPVELIEEVLGRRVAEGNGPSRAPGMLPSHYAPAVEVRLSVPDRATDEVADLVASGRRVGFIGPGAVPLPPSVTRLGTTDDEPEAARKLYRWLRQADAGGLDVLVAVLPPPAGLGRAVRDRLIKAAAPRPRA